ncbi:uncharacterized protein BT62DRAFT_1011018 [Guyanagaster necrorhizus]|uniref:Uncharacterized protein n=1 Tax=Guyanagaster necrorhizus TaxID=856835 RepID=A0A9P8ANJ4_9AGAR|nr:uncharacterized protein BT62DRAFT_1011018 [Guyanagaster necrorhizus MCA 3950]KAG7441980.1 hypothetical protein BT62DRAFT_1011018 [Guyanagaster necrorhizus MCA 3950]
MPLVVPMLNDPQPLAAFGSLAQSHETLTSAKATFLSLFSRSDAIKFSFSLAFLVAVLEPAFPVQFNIVLSLRLRFY